VFGEHANPSNRWRSDLLNSTLEGGVWWLDNPTRTARTAWGCPHSDASVACAINVFNNI